MFYDTSALPVQVWPGVGACPPSCRHGNRWWAQVSRESLTCLTRVTCQAWNGTWKSETEEEMGLLLSDVPILSPHLSPGKSILSAVARKRASWLSWSRPISVSVHQPVLNWWNPIWWKRNLASVCATVRCQLCKYIIFKCMKRHQSMLIVSCTV